MKTTALRIYGKNDLRLETFDLPPMGDDEIVCEVITDSVCMSSHKAAIQGAEHKRVPRDVAQNPTIIGHEFAGYVREVGGRWADTFRPGDKFCIQPAIEYKGSLDAPGYSYRWIGGMATFVLVPHFFMECDGVLPYEGDAFFKASLSEPMSCVIGAARAQYHTDHHTHRHEMGIVQGGRCAILAGAGPMGLGCVDYLVHGPKKPGLLVVTDVDQARLDRAASLWTVGEAARFGVRLKYVNTAAEKDPAAALKALSGGNGYDDVFVYAPVANLIEQADAILDRDGCLNFFAGPTRSDFSAKLNFYNAHYVGTHVVGTSGGNVEDMKEALSLVARGVVNPSAMITHVGGLTCGAETILNLPAIPGGKKLIYTHCDLPLTAIADFAAKGKTDRFYADLAVICAGNAGLWCTEAEEYLIANAPGLSHPERFSPN